MSKIVVLADSSCDFTPAQAAKAGFDIVPLSVTFEDGTVVRDGVDISSKEYFERLTTSKILPKTSQPSPDVYMEYFSKYSDCDDIIYISISSKLSGSLNAATNAAAILKDEGFTPKIHLVDSLNASASSGLMAMEAAKMAREGSSASDIVTRIIQLRERVGMYFVLDTLEYLQRGGRIGKVSAVVGNMLGIKPMLSVVDGIAVSVDKTRGFQQACKKLIDKFLNTAKDIDKVIIIHANSEDRALKLRAAITHSVAEIECMIVEVGSVMGTYAGPGGVALVFEEKEPRW